MENLEILSNLVVFFTLSSIGEEKLGKQREGKEAENVYTTQGLCRVRLIRGLVLH